MADFPHHSLAAEYSLYPIYKEEFHQIFAEHSEQKEFKELMVRMKVVDANGESSMDEDQWEAASKPSCVSRRISYSSRCQTFILGLRLRSGEVSVVDSLVDMHATVSGFI